MKLSEITGSKEDGWLNHSAFRDCFGFKTQAKIVDGRVDARDIIVEAIDLEADGFEFPFPFGTVATWEVIGIELKSFKNFPLIATEAVKIGSFTNVKNPYNIAAKANNQIKSLDGITAIVPVLNINVPKVTSLIGISDHLKQVKEMFFNFNRITSGGLGLLQIEDLKTIHQSNGANLIEPFEIIKKYIGTDNIIECQSELIEAGYEEYAQL